MGGRQLVAAALCGLLAAPGCASMLRPPRAGPAPAVSGDGGAQERYLEVLSRVTRRAELYDRLDTRVFLAATLSTLAFREARAVRVATFRSLGAAEAEALLAAERKAHGEALEVILGLHANEQRFDDLARPGSIWTLELVTEAGGVAPGAIERIARPDANQIALYPYLEPFWTGYKLRFPRTFANGAQVLPEGARQVTLRLSSAVGKAELAFDLDPAAAGGAGWP